MQKYDSQTTPVEKKYSDFLRELRDSGQTNMFGATPYLQLEFGLKQKEASAILCQWMEEFEG